MSNKLEQLEFKLEKIIGIWKHAGKVRKKIFWVLHNLMKNKIVSKVHESYEWMMDSENIYNDTFYENYWVSITFSLWIWCPQWY